jgi:hypothetical protein
MAKRHIILTARETYCGRTPTEADGHPHEYEEDTADPTRETWCGTCRRALPRDPYGNSPYRP